MHWVIEENRNTWKDEDKQKMQILDDLCELKKTGNYKSKHRQQKVGIKSTRSKK